MKDDFEESLKLVLVHEGGWSDDPRDPGGATMKGVTLAVFRRYYGADRTKKDLKNISSQQLAHIYKDGYWDKCRGDQLPAGLDYAVFDGAVNSGPGRAARWLQAAVGAAVDGGIGDATLAKVAKVDPVDAINSALDQRLAFLKSLPTWAVFGKGWRRRVEDVRKKAMEMAGDPAPKTTLTPEQHFDIVRLGSTGEWVIKLQVALNAEYKELNLKVDGRFEASTEEALKRFQKEHGLVPDGVAGRNTYRALGLIS